MQNTDHDLREVSAQEAAEQFKKWAKDEYQPSTYENHCTTVNLFVSWLRDTEFTFTEVDGWVTGQFEDWLREQDYANVTRKQYLSQLRAFLRWGSRRNVVKSGVAEKVELPNLSRDDVRSDTSIGPDRVQRILDYMDRYRRASREHIIILLLFRTGARLGALRGVDLSMVHLQRNKPQIEVRHRPEIGCPLKNGERNKREAERPILIDEETAQVVAEYIEHHRKDVTDSHGNRPLLTTKHGRVSDSVIKKTVKQWTCPAATEGECPIHDHRPSRREVGSCARECGHTNAHSLRKASITHFLNRGVSVEVVSDRMNVSIETIQNHYDRPTDEERQPDRRARWKRCRLTSTASYSYLRSSAIYPMRAGVKSVPATRVN